MKKAVVGIFIGIILGAIGFYIKIEMFDKAERIDFADETMGRLIVWQSYTQKNVETFREKDLEYVTELIVPYLGDYETLSDIGKCWNLQRLDIQKYDYGAEQVYLPLTTTKVEQIEDELGGILCACKKLEMLFFFNQGGICNLNSLQFLSYGKSLELLHLEEQGSIDYSPILECTNLEVLCLYKCDISNLGQISRIEKLKYLDLSYTGISEVGDMVNLKHLETLYITGTPLAENAEEIQILREALPELEIITDGYPWN